MIKRVWLFLLLTSCMLGPNYKRPETPVSDAWTANVGDSEDPVIDQWWKLFNDPLLDQYVDLAIQSNYTLQNAEANITRARALRLITASKFFPQLTADINGTKTYFSKNGPVFVIGQATGNAAVTTSPLTGLPFVIQIPQIQNLFNALFDASWELDFFGKTRRAVEAANADIESAIANKDDLLITVLAELARNYIDLRSFQTKAELINTQIRLYEEERSIVEAQLANGYVSRINLEQIDASLASIRAELPNTNAEIYRAIFTLSILIGHPPETLVDELLANAPLLTPPSHIAIGLRSDLLRRRPDIRYAERKLASATAHIGVAVASFFPTVSLLANGGFQSLVLPELFEWGSRTWAYGADVSQPIFQGGRLVGSLRLAKAESAMAAAEYQQTVLSALQDAETSLKQYQEQSAATQQIAEMESHTHALAELSDRRFHAGLINKIERIHAQENLINADLQLLDSKTAELLNLISLYKALGGGWEVGDQPEPPCSTTQ